MLINKEELRIGELKWKREKRAAFILVKQRKEEQVLQEKID